MRIFNYDTDNIFLVIIQILAIGLIVLMLFVFGFFIYDSIKSAERSQAAINAIKTEEDWNQFLISKLGINLENKPDYIRIPLETSFYRDTQVDSIINYIMSRTNVKYEMIPNAKTDIREWGNVKYYELKKIK